MPAGGTVVPVPMQPPLLMVTVPAVVVTPFPVQPPLLMVTVPALLVLVMVMVTVPAALQMPSRTGRSLPMGASVLATRRTLLQVQCRRCRPPHQEKKIAWPCSPGMVCVGRAWAVSEP
jgi:hypothetical protein